MSSRLEVTKTRLAAAIRLAGYGIARHPGARIRLSLIGSELQLLGPEAQAAAPATGIWPAAVLVDAFALKKLAGRLPKGRPLVLATSERGLHIGNVVLRAQVLDLAPAPIEPLVVGSDSAGVIQAIFRHGRPAVLAAVGATLVDEAERDLHRHISNAAYNLRPFGIDADLMRHWIYEQLEQRHQRGRST